MEKLEKVIEKVNKYCKKHLTEKRYNHSVRVAEMCSEIATKTGHDIRKAYLCGIAHDICKEIPKPKMVKMVSKAGLEITDYEMSHPSLLHGKAGSIFLQKKFSIKDRDIIDAVAVHVSGGLKLEPYAMILYIADKNERGRSHVTEDFLQRMFLKNLEEMYGMSVENTYTYLKAKNFEIYDDTYKLMDKLGIKY